VPTQSWDLLASPHFAEHDTSSLRSVGGGGAPAPPELVRRVASSFAKASPGIGYGMTETNAYGPQNGGEDYLTHPTSTGRATPILQVEVRDEQGNTLAPGEAGEICFKGPNLIRGYWNKPEATAEAIVDGWLRSGDIGRIDVDGFVYVEDRAKDMVLRGGENVYCAEVEAALYEHPDVHEAAVFGVPHDRLGEEVAAAILPRAGAHVTVAELQDHVRER
jgi:long-chain acyl-CoA synthetase